MRVCKGWDLQGAGQKYKIDMQIMNNYVTTMYVCMYVGLAAPITCMYGRTYLYIHTQKEKFRKLLLYVCRSGFNCVNVCNL